MKYTDKKADEVSRKFRVADATIKVWKHRGEIPDKYNNENFKVKEALSKAEMIMQQRIVEVLKSKFINTTVLIELAGVDKNRYKGVLTKGISFSKDDILALKGEINKIKLGITKTFESKQESAFKNLLKSKIFHFAPIWRLEGGTNIDRDRFSRFAQGKISMESVNYELAKNCFMKVALMLNL